MKINQVLVESTGPTVAFAFGRFNPAHQGHIEVWRAVEDAGANWFIGTNPSTLGPNDPLTFQQKSAWMEEIYPPIAGHIVAEQTVLTLAAYIFKKLRKNERATVAYITDATDWAWSGKLLNQYNGQEGAHGYYKFAQITHVPSPRVSSATALRDAARADDKVAFYHASGTDPKSKVAGKTYFDTVKEACAKYPVPVKRGQKVAEAYDHNAPFNAADFQRHMDQLRAREELRKTDPMRALVGDLIDKDREKEALAKRKKPEDDSMSTSDPRHPQYSYTQAGKQGVAEGSIGDKIKGAAKSVKRAAQGWGVGGAPDMITPKGVVQAFGNMDGQRLANFVASRKELSKPGKDSARAFADKVIDREMKQRGYGRVADKDEPGVAEAFDKPYRSKTEKSESGSFDVLAKLPDGTNLSIMFNNEGNDEWQVEFYRNNSQEVTGEGDAQRIFATVLSAIQKFIAKHKPAHLTFAASKETDPTIVYEPGEPQPNPASRAKLYDRLVQRYAKSWGYKAFRADNGHIVMYELSRINEQGVAEGSNDTIYPNAEVIKSKNGKPVGEIYQDGDGWGCFHYRADRGYDMIDSREDAIEALKDLHQETGRSRPDYTIKGVAEGMDKTQKAAIKGMHQLSGDEYYGLYQKMKDIAGHDGKKQTAPNGKSDGEIKDKPFAYAYTDVEEKMIKGVDPKAKKITSSKSEEVKESSEQKTIAKTWDQMTSQEKLSGVKGRTAWNEKTKRYYTVFDVPVVQNKKSVEESAPYWTNLPQSMTTDDKIAFFEQYYTKGNLLESNDSSSAEYFKMLADQAINPIGDQQYIVVPLMLVNNQLKLIDAKPSRLKFLGQDSEGLVFTGPDGYVTYPPRRFSAIAMTHTFVFDTSSDYDKFRTLVSLRFNTVLPALTEIQSEASLATMRDYFAGDTSARDPLEITKQRLHFSKEPNSKSTRKEFRSQAEYELWLKRNKLRQISSVKEDEEAGEVKKTGQLIPFPQGTTKVSVSDVYDWYKLGQVISDLDDADPAEFGQGAPETVIAFGSEEEEHKLLPLLQRLGLKLKDIDQPVAEAYDAGSLYDQLKKQPIANWTLINKKTL